MLKIYKLNKDYYFIEKCLICLNLERDVMYDRDSESHQIALSWTFIISVVSNISINIKMDQTLFKLYIIFSSIFLFSVLI